MDIYGTTRSKTKSHYALITPDTHVRSPLVGWTNAEAVVHITPTIGARFVQYTAYMAANSTSNRVSNLTERFVYVIAGEVQLHSQKLTSPTVLKPGFFAYIPAGSDAIIKSTDSSSLAVFEKKFLPLPDSPLPELVVGDATKVNSEAFTGDQDAQLKTLLPKNPTFDMAVNLFTFQPGATLPLVEVHVMEHGLLLLEGAGVYRLGDDYHPIKAGDVIWMASFCPQWWVAMGKTPSTYLYYKDVYRECLEATL